MPQRAGNFGGQRADGFDPQSSVLVHEFVKELFCLRAEAHTQSGHLRHAPAQVGVVVFRVRASLGLAVAQFDGGTESAVGHEIGVPIKPLHCSDFRCDE